mgnify:CR=1 FL=1|tara:strand:+ start:1076 stop:1240 length:165 start_codon:yes stop_codon:yes gene_type:complete
MMSFNISNLWQNKQKNHTRKHKLMHSSSSKPRSVKDEWAMSAEDALRIPYAGNK